MVDVHRRAIAQPTETYGLLGFFFVYGRIVDGQAQIRWTRSLLHLDRTERLTIEPDYLAHEKEHQNFRAHARDASCMQRPDSDRRSADPLAANTKVGSLSVDMADAGRSSKRSPTRISKEDWYDTVSSRDKS